MWYCWGSGGSGCLLLPNLDDFSTPQASSSSLTSVICGGCHCLSINQDSGLVYAWGDNKFGQCYQSPEQQIVQSPTALRLPEKVLLVACGWRHSLFLFESGRIGSCGHKSVIGRPIDSVPAHEIGLIDFASRAVAISCGYEHSTVLDISNSLWLWGSNKFGQIGLPKDHKRYDRPVQSNIPTEVIPTTAVCGFRHTAVLTSDGKILTVGSNKYGQLGRQDGFDGSLGCHLWLPVCLQQEVRFVALTSGWSHCMALSDDHRVWAWGRGGRISCSIAMNKLVEISSDLGQQGDGHTLHRPEPHCVFLPDAIGEIFCGSEHSVCIDRSSTSMFVFGWNEHGNLGVGDEMNRSDPTRLQIPDGRIRKFATGGAVCFAYVQ